MVVRRIEAHRDHPKAVLVQCVARLFYHLVQVLGGGGADMVAAGEDHADHQRLAAVVRQGYRQPLGSHELDILQGISDDRLTVGQGIVAAEGGKIRLRRGNCRR